MISIFKDQECQTPLNRGDPLNAARDHCYGNYTGQSFSIIKAKYLTCNVQIYTSPDCSGNTLYYVIANTLSSTSTKHNCINHITGPIHASPTTSHDVEFNSIMVACPDSVTEKEFPHLQKIVGHDGSNGQGSEGREGGSGRGTSQGERGGGGPRRPD